MKLMGRPLWSAATALGCLLPLVLYAELLNRMPIDMTPYVRIYPAYAIFTAWLAWYCWPRKAVYWILLTLLLLTQAALWLPILLNINTM